MIPKIIHYCWFGKGEYPSKIKQCIESWNKLANEYQILLWNEENFDINAYDFTREAYEAGKYAFVSDMVRFYALYHYGGIYVDTDVEIVKSFSDILKTGCVLSGDESGNLDGAFLAGEKQHPFFSTMLNSYKERHFLNKEGKFNQIVVNYWMQEELKKNGYQSASSIVCLNNDIMIYPVEYFCAMDQFTGKTCATSNTYCIHHHTYSWTSKKTDVLRFFRTKILVPLLGKTLYSSIVEKIKKLINHKEYIG